MEESAFLHAADTWYYVNLFFNEAPDSLIAYGCVKSELEKFLQKKINGEDLVYALEDNGYETGRISFNFFQLYINGEEFETLKSINRAERLCVDGGGKLTIGK